MKVSKRKKEKILNDIKACVRCFGLPIVDEVISDERPIIVSKFQYEHYGFGIAAAYHPDGDLVEIQTCYGNAPENKIKPLCELMNHINSHIMNGHFYVGHPDGEMSFRTAVHVPDSLNQEEFEWALNQVMGASFRFFPMIAEQLCTDGDPIKILKKHLEREPMEVDS